MMLPKLDGLSLIAEMRKLGRKTPVIILSAMRSVDDRMRGLERGSDDYLTKPFAFAELIARIHSWFNRFRELLVRYEKLVESYGALVCLAAAIICWGKVGIIYG
jgi:DNA-binding response OmpR family regulator